MDNPITLEWQSLCPVLDGLNKEVCGVYIWGFKLDDRFIIYYIGKGKNIKVRLAKHVRNLMGGNYTIFSQDQLPNFYKYKASKEKGHRIYDPPRLFDQEFYTERKKIRPHMDFMVENMHFTYAEVEEAKIGDAEVALINQFGKDFLINTMAGKSDAKLKHEAVGLIRTAIDEAILRKEKALG